jgi:hypothetical protein
MTIAGFGIPQNQRYSGKEDMNSISVIKSHYCPGVNTLSADFVKGIIGIII